MEIADKNTSSFYTFPLYLDVPKTIKFNSVYYTMLYVEIYTLLDLGLSWVYKSTQHISLAQAEDNKITNTTTTK